MSSFSAAVTEFELGVSVPLGPVDRLLVGAEQLSAGAEDVTAGASCMMHMRRADMRRGDKDDTDGASVLVTSSACELTGRVRGGGVARSPKVCVVQCV